MAGANKLMTSGGGGVIITPATNIAADVTVNVPSVNGTLGVVQNNIITSGTAQASTSGTSIDFTGIPAGVKRITVMFNGVSTNGTSQVEVRIGSGSVVSTGYASYGSTNGSNISSTTGFVTTYTMSAAYSIIGKMEICLVSGTTYVSGSVLTLNPLNATSGAGNVTLTGVLDRVRITTVNGTDTFDAGSINILWE